MNATSRRPCTVGAVETETGITDGCRRLRLTLHNPHRPDRTAQQPREEPKARAVPLVKPPNERQPLRPEPIKPTEEKVEVIKVYLRGRKQEQAQKQAQQQSLRMLSDEVSQIQEVRYCLKTLREQMAARNNSTKLEHKFPANGFRVPSPDSQPAAPGHKEEEDVQDWEEENDCSKLREASRRLYARLQETEERHRAERERLQGQCGQYEQQLSERAEGLRAAERRAQAQEERVRELQRLLTGMERESAALRAQAEQREEELGEARALGDGGSDRRVEELEKEQAILKEKIHHLDDMLKSQQRKVRHMIEQLQNSRTVIQERDREIQDLQEKVSYLEAENRELRDQMDFYMGGQNPNPPAQSSSDHRGQIVYSKPLTPNGHGKSLPFIKVIEIKS